MTQSQPFVIPSSPAVMTRLHSPVPLILFGIIQVSCGIGMIITDIVYFCLLGTTTAFFYNIYASGLYFGAFFVLTGAFGISAGRPLSTGVSPRSRKCVLITSMVLSILSIFPSAAVIALILLAYRGIGALAFLPVNFYFHAIVIVAHLAQSVSAGVNLCNMPSRMPVSNTASAQSYCIPGFSAEVPMTVVNQQSPHGEVASLYPTLAPQPAFGAVPLIGQAVTTRAPVSERNDIGLKS